MQLLIQVSIHAHFIAFLKNALVDQLLFFSLSRVSPEVLGTREHELILGNKGTKLYKSEEKNIASKFMKRGVNNLHSAGHEIAPNTVANATKIIVLATKIQKLVAKLATRTL